MLRENDAVSAVESSSSAMSWGPIVGGAIAAAGISLILLLLGSGLGLTMLSPWPGQSSSLATVGATAAVWIVVVQWLSSAFGGYLTGRLRTKWAAVHTDEVFFRDTAHGFLSWALATLFVTMFLASSLGTLLGAGAQTAGAAGAAIGATASTAVSATQASDWPTTYFTDALLRPDQVSAPATGDNSAAAGEVTRILLNGAAKSEIPEADKAYLAKIVSARAALSETDARARVDDVLKNIEDAKIAAQQAADTARKTAATTALLGALSLLIGAFIAAAAAALGGSQRDEEEDLIVRRA